MMLSTKTEYVIELSTDGLKWVGIAEQPGPDFKVAKERFEMQVKQSLSSESPYSVRLSERVILEQEKVIKANLVTPYVEDAPGECAHEFEDDGGFCIHCGASASSVFCD